jgi:hypothetical protein
MTDAFQGGNDIDGLGDHLVEAVTIFTGIYNGATDTVAMLQGQGGDGYLYRKHISGLVQGVTCWSLPVNPSWLIGDHLRRPYAD